MGLAKLTATVLTDLDQAKIDLVAASKSYVACIRNVCESIDLPDNNFVNEPWPSHIYFEDVNGETQFDLVRLILNEAYPDPSFDRRLPQIL